MDAKFRALLIVGGFACLSATGLSAQVSVPEGFELIEPRDYGEAQVLFLRSL